MADRPIIFSAPMVRSLLSGAKTQTRRVLRAQVPPQPEANCHPRHKPKHPAPYLDAYCSEPKTALNPRGMSNQWCWWQVDDRQCLPTFKVPFVPGDRLWVRENWQTGMSGDGPKIAYAATPDFVDIDAWDGPDEGVGPSFNYDRCPGAKWSDWLPDVLSNDGPWRPSIHMPRWASRLTLVVEAVKVERLQDISEEDANAEGARVAYGEPLDAEGNALTDRRRFELLWRHLHSDFNWDANPWVVAISFSVHRCNIDALSKAKEEANG